MQPLPGRSRRFVFFIYHDPAINRSEGLSLVLGERGPSLSPPEARVRLARFSLSSRPSADSRLARAFSRPRLAAVRAVRVSSDDFSSSRGQGECFGDFSGSHAGTPQKSYESQ